ncbi:MAG TPA: LamB/YcsF family protein [Propionicimonas sp.]|nr:LamB/YcsF family protein [Propionicimonas sp.]
MRIDLNAELGRGLDEAWGELEAGFWPLLSSVAIPCGGHAGEPATMLATAATAGSRGIAVGAALGYRDSQGRGQRYVEDDADSLAADLLYQLGGLDALVAGEAGALGFVRPSGSLAEAVVANRSHAWAIVNAVLDFDPTLVVVGPADSLLLATASRHGLRVASEVEPRRNGAGGPLSTDPAEIAARAVVAAERTEATLLHLGCRNSADLTVARAVRAALEQAGCSIGSLVDAPATASPETPPRTASRWTWQPRS